MKINTRKFGEIEIDDKKILTMPEGLPGFPGFERFVLFEDPKAAPFCWFQSIEAPNLSLIVMNPVVFKPDYQLNLQGLIADRDWKEVKPDKLLIVVVINIKEDECGKRITANLMGPLVINLENQEAIQMALCDSDYSHQYDVLGAISNNDEN
ncbi:MAG: flagellar assembly protein FliW [Desulfobacula sp.]|nr:flagellar assembly protein FliW [Desulfobacula sp.]